MKTVVTSILSLLVPMLCALMLWVVPQTASAYNWKFCLRWNVSSTDTGIGEDFYPISTGAPARNALVHWSEPPPSGLSGYRRLDGNGCFNLNSSHSSGFTFKLYADLKMGQTGNIRVKGYASAQDLDNGTVTRWTIYSGNLGGSGGTRYFYVPVDPMGRLMGYGQWAVKRLDGENPISGNETMNLVSRPCNDPGSGSCAPYPDVHIEPGDENYKFLIGHEIGHWFHYAWGTLTGHSYSKHPGNDWDCYFTNSSLGAHALRSLEYAGGAYVEGTAHFLSALAFNNASQAAWFRYYKEAVVDLSEVPFGTVLAYNDLGQGNFRVDVDGGSNAVGGTSAWMRNKCPNEAVAGTGVEMDWMRFWWDVRTDDMWINGQLISNLSTKQIFDFLTYARGAVGWNRETLWQALNQAIALPNSSFSYYSGAFTSIANSNGVNY